MATAGTKNTSTSTTMLLMTMKGVAPPQVTMLHIFRAVMPFLLISIVVLVLVFFVPAVATWLPGWVG